MRCEKSASEWQQRQAGEREGGPKWQRKTGWARCAETGGHGAAEDTQQTSKRPIQALCDKAVQQDDGGAIKVDIRMAHASGVAVAGADLLVGAEGRLDDPGCRFLQLKPLRLAGLLQGG